MEPETVEVTQLASLWLQKVPDMYPLFVVLSALLAFQEITVPSIY